MNNSFLLALRMWWQSGAWLTAGLFVFGQEFSGEVFVFCVAIVFPIVLFVGIPGIAFAVLLTWLLKLLPGSAPFKFVGFTLFLLGGILFYSILLVGNLLFSVSFSFVPGLLLLVCFLNRKRIKAVVAAVEYAEPEFKKIEI